MSAAHSYLETGIKVTCQRVSKRLIAGVRKLDDDTAARLVNAAGDLMEAFPEFAEQLVDAFSDAVADDADALVRA